MTLPDRLLLTGATGSLGQLLARLLARRGVELVLLGRRQRVLEQLDDEIRSAGGRAPVLHPCDLLQLTPRSADELAALTEGIGGIDGLVLASTRLTGLSTTEQTDPAEWLKSLQVNVSAPFLLLSALLPQLRARAGVVLATLMAPAAIERAFWGCHGATQAALRHLLAGTADECETLGPRVVAAELPPFQGSLRRLIYPGHAEPHLPAPTAVARALLPLLDRACRLRGVVSVEAS